jgi:hypothetical protein
MAGVIVSLQKRRLIAAGLVLISQSISPLASVADDDSSNSLFRDVVKGVAVEVISDLIMTQIHAHADTPSQQMPTTSSRASDVGETNAVSGNSDDIRRVKAIISALIDTSTPLSERIGLYATRVDYFSAGVVDHDFIMGDRLRFETRWPEESYTIVSIDQIAVEPDRTSAVARYTLAYTVRRPGDQRSGTSQNYVLLGSFDSQPRVYAIKEWVSRRAMAQ